MATFSGFPTSVKYAAIPRLFFSDLLSQIHDLAELKVTLYLLSVISTKRGNPRYVTDRELKRDLALLGSPINGESDLAQALGLAVERGIFLSCTLERDAQQENIYLLNTESDRRDLEKIERGEISLGAVPIMVEKLPPKKINIFSLYEANIGVLTPMIAEQLAEAEGLYPAIWVEEAFGEAAALNRRSWRYISRILENWKREGRDGEAGRHSTEAADPNKYTKGDYGHLIER